MSSDLDQEEKRMIHGAGSSSKKNIPLKVKKSSKKIASSSEESEDSSSSDKESNSSDELALFVKRFDKKFGRKFGNKLKYQVQKVFTSEEVRNVQRSLLQLWQEKTLHC